MREAMKKISVIVPCYNVGYFIDRLLDCLVRQTMPLSDFEIILINDASTDNTLEKLMTWEEKYEDSIIIINFEENMGQGTARNVGMENASGEYIAFIDADDWVELNYLEVMYNVGKESGCDIVKFGYDRQYVYNKIENIKEIQEKVNVYDLSSIRERKKYISDDILSCAVWGKLHKRAFLEETGICFPCKTYYEDTYFVCLSYMYANKIAESGEALYHYYKNINGTIMGNSENKRLDRLVAMRMLYDITVSNGLISDYYDEIELIFIRIYLTEVMDSMFRTYSEIDYNLYCAIRDWILEKFPNCASNKYLNSEFYNLDRMFLQCIQNDLNELQLKAFRKMYLGKIYNKDKPDTICSQEIMVTEFPQHYDMFDLFDKVITKVKEDKEISDDFNDLKCMISCMPVINDGDILSICNSNVDILPAEIYRYYINREIFISALKDMIRRNQIEEKYKLEICNKILDIYNELIVEN